MLVCTKCTINIYVVFLFHYVLLLYSSSRLYVTSGGSQEACARGTRPPVQVPNYSFLHVKFSKPKDDFIFLVQNYLDPPLVTPQSSNFPLLYSCMLIRLTKRGSKRQRWRGSRGLRRSGSPLDSLQHTSIHGSNPSIFAFRCPCRLFPSPFALIPLFTLLLKMQCRWDNRSTCTLQVG